MMSVPTVRANELDPKFVEFLVKIHSSVEEFEKLPLAEKAAVYANFESILTSQQSRADSTSTEATLQAIQQSLRDSASTQEAIQQSLRDSAPTQEAIQQSLLGNVRERLSQLGDLAIARLKNQFAIARLEDIDPGNFDFLPLPPNDGNYGSNEIFDWGCNGEDATNTAAFNDRLRTSCNGAQTEWDFANVSGRQLFFCKFTQDSRHYEYGGRTDLAVLPKILCATRQTNATVVARLRMVIELKTPSKFVEGDNQIIGELLLALFSSEMPVVHGVLTSGSSWKFYWLVRVGEELVIRRCEVQGWTNGVRHLLAMLQTDVQNTERIVPFKRFPSLANDDNDMNESDMDDEDDDFYVDRRVRPRLGESIGAVNAEGDDLDDMEDWYDAEGKGSHELRNEQLIQRLVWATHKLPEFAKIPPKDGNWLSEENLHNRKLATWQCERF